jgi:hypothetical protein
VPVGPGDFGHEVRQFAPSGCFRAITRVLLDSGRRHLTLAGREIALGSRQEPEPEHRMRRVLLRIVAARLYDFADTATVLQHASLVYKRDLQRLAQIVILLSQATKSFCH